MVKAFKIHEFPQKGWRLIKEMMKCPGAMIKVRQEKSKIAVSIEVNKNGKQA